MALLTKKLTNLLNDKDCRVTEIISADKVRAMLADGGAGFGKNWYGQLMTVPQTFAYFLQIDRWMREYDVIIEK